MSYRQDGYDIHKWTAAEAKRQARRPSTRWLLLVGLLLALAMPVICVLEGGDERDVVNVAAYMPLFIAFSLSPFGRDSLFASKRLASFDEFERAALAHATRRAYAVLLAVALAGVGWLWVAVPRGWPVPVTSQDWSACAFSLLFGGMALPVVFAEWMVPLPPALDEMED